MSIDRRKFLYGMAAVQGVAVFAKAKDICPLPGAKEDSKACANGKMEQTSYPGFFVILHGAFVSRFSKSSDGKYKPHVYVMAPTVRHSHGNNAHEYWASFDKPDATPAVKQLHGDYVLRIADWNNEALCRDCSNQIWLDGHQKDKPNMKLKEYGVFLPYPTAVIARRNAKAPALKKKGNHHFPPEIGMVTAFYYSFTDSRKITFSDAVPPYGPSFPPNIDIGGTKLHLFAEPPDFRDHAAFKHVIDLSEADDLASDYNPNSCVPPISSADPLKEEDLKSLAERNGVHPPCTLRNEVLASRVLNCINVNYECDPGEENCECTSEQCP